jgi:cytidylate kinase
VLSSDARARRIELARGLGEGYARLAERQAARWSAEEAARAEKAYAPAVALSRLPGAGGEEIGRLLAEKLDYGLFDRELLDQVAKELHVDHWVLRGLDERVRTGIERSISELAGRTSVLEDQYLRAVTRAIATVGRRGRVVVVGRGAPFILTSDEALRVLVVAPRAERVKRYARVKAIPAAESEAALDQAERDRAAFARRQFGVEHTDPTLYDLSVNTGTLGFEHAVDLVVQALRARFPDAAPFHGAAKRR